MDPPFEGSVCVYIHSIVHNRATRPCQKLIFRCCSNMCCIFDFTLDLRTPDRTNPPSSLHQPKRSVVIVSGIANYVKPTTVEQTSAEMNVRRVQVGDRFTKPVELCKAVERCFRADKKQLPRGLEGHRFEKQALRTRWSGIRRKSHEQR